MMKSQGLISVLYLLLVIPQVASLILPKQGRSLQRSSKSTFPSLPLANRRTRARWRTKYGYFNTLHMNDGGHHGSRKRHPVLKRAFNARHSFRNYRNQLRFFSKSNDFDDDLDDYESKNSNHFALKNEDNGTFWSPSWMPPWLSVLGPGTQLLLGTTFFALNYSLLTIKGLGFPVLTELGLDSLTGVLSITGLTALKKYSDQIDADLEIENYDDSYMNGTSRRSNNYVATLPPVIDEKRFESRLEPENASKTITIYKERLDTQVVPEKEKVSTKSKSKSKSKSKTENDDPLPAPEIVDNRLETKSKSISLPKEKPKTDYSPPKIPKDIPKPNYSPPKIPKEKPKADNISQKISTTNKTNKYVPLDIPLRTEKKHVNKHVDETTKDTSSIVKVDKEGPTNGDTLWKKLPKTKESNVPKSKENKVPKSKKNTTTATTTTTTTTTTMVEYKFKDSKSDKIISKKIPMKVKRKAVVPPSKDDGDNSKTVIVKKQENRPDWATSWMPTWLVNMHPIVQLILGGSMYVFHLTVLTQRGIAFPFQLVPNDSGKFQSIGLDSVAGMVSLMGLFLLRKNTKNNPVPAVPKVLEEPYYKDLPWKKLYSKGKKGIPYNASIRAFTYLLIAYAGTGKFTLWFESLLYVLAGMGVPMTIAMHRSLTVLLGHLSWVGIGSLILKYELKPFFNRKKTKWYKLKWDTNWLWWTIGGYFVSAWLFNIADFINQVVLPASVFEKAGEGVVSQLINPENNDLAASMVGYIAPCLSAPWWEETLYRGFILPALCLHMRFWPASIISALIFSAHHMSTTGFIPLAVLGMTWATLYAKCGNLLVTILIHAMWNSRVFLGSWFGL